VKRKATVKSRRGNRTSKRSSLTDRIYRAIREAILDAPLHQAPTLSERDLAKRYRVSKTPVREALIRLAKDGFIEISPRKGISITKISVQDLREVFGIRSALEGLGAESAAGNIPLSALTKLKDEFYAAAENKDQQRLYRLGEDLHQLIAAGCNNQRLAGIVDTMRAQIARYSKLASRLPEQTDNSLRDHLRIIQALEREDGPEARRAIEDHIKGVKANLIRSLL
jgi:DNA-binding GntR family transcriptional regulator